MAELLRDREAYKKIETQLEARRDKSRRDLDMRRALAYKSNPELAGIDYEIAAEGVALNRALLAGELTPEAARREIDEKVGALSGRRVRLLRESGFPDDYLKIAPICAACGDTGYVPGDGGVPERCACFRRLLYGLLESDSNILAAGAANFDLFDETLFSDQIDKAKYRQTISPRDNILKLKNSAKRFIGAFNDGKYENLYFFGDPGTGKTFMASAIAHELMRGGASVLYLSAPSLFDIIIEYRFRSYRDDEYGDTLYRQIYACKLLIIDDLGTESITDARYSEFVALLNERLAFAAPLGGYGPDGTRASRQPQQPRLAKSTILSSNLDLKTLKSRYDDRIVSRILGSFRMIYFFGDDLRVKLRGMN